MAAKGAPRVESGVGAKEAVRGPDCARAAGLRYVTDAEPGIRRECRDGEFAYIRPDGRVIDDPDDLRRIRALAIPPAYRDVWICLTREGHLQATGRDARGRKQYRYHPHWQDVRDETKFHRLLAFAAALPRIRERVERELSRPGLPREKVLALVVRLLEITHIRVGNEAYVRENGSFGLTTLRDEHVAVAGATLRFHFRGKSGKEHAIDVHDRRLAQIVKRCRDIPGHELFQFVDDQGCRHTIDSADVNGYLHHTTGTEFTAKDFRTWAGTVLCALALRELGPAATAAAAKRNVAAAVKAVAGRLGNTPAVCRKGYVHPAIPAAYQDGGLFEHLREPPSADGAAGALHPEEEAVVRVIRAQEGDELPACAR